MIIFTVTFLKGHSVWVYVNSVTIHSPLVTVKSFFGFQFAF